MTCLCRPSSICTKVPRKRQLGKATLETQPKLFGGSIEEYCEVRRIYLCLWFSLSLSLVNYWGSDLFKFSELMWLLILNCHPHVCQNKSISNCPFVWFLLQATGQEIPAIVRSCTRIINLYGTWRLCIWKAFIISKFWSW